MGWEKDSQAREALIADIAYHTVGQYSQKFTRKHIQKNDELSIGARKNGGHPLAVFSRSFMLSIPLALTLPFFSLTAQAEGKWVQAEEQWQYQMEGQIQKGWKEISGSTSNSCFCFQNPRHFAKLRLIPLSDLQSYSVLRMNISLICRMILIFECRKESNRVKILSVDKERKLDL